MSSTYTCDKCGVISDQRDHLCQPKENRSSADFCGSSPEQGSQICESMAQHLEFECSNCGRPAEKPELLCKPVNIR